MKITQRAYGRDYYPLRLNLTGQSRFVLPTVAHLNASRWSGPGAMRETFTRGDASDASAMQSDHRSAEYKRVRLRSFALLVIFGATAQGQSVHDLFGGDKFHRAYIEASDVTFEPFQELPWEAQARAALPWLNLDRPTPSHWWSSGGESNGVCVPRILRQDPKQSSPPAKAAPLDSH